MKLTLIALASLALAGLLCYGALRTAEAIAKASNARITQVEVQP